MSAGDDAGGLRRDRSGDQRRQRPARPVSRRLVAAIAAGAVALAALVGVAVWQLTPREEIAAPPPTTTVAPATPTPAATPTPIGPVEFAANETVYTLDALPQMDVFAVVAALPVDEAPTAPLPGITARAATAGIPVFADPAGEPVAFLPRDYFFDGTTVAVIEQQSHWARVLLTGRAAIPSNGDPGQVTGWVRAQDVEFAAVTQSVEVDLAARTVDIVSADGTRERVADDFGWGADATPTPLGRSFIMLSRSEPSLEYTRGHPLVYLSVQSPTLDGFDGADVAVTAFHYHDDRSGAISNGCLRMDPEAIDRLGELPLGTPVYIR